VNDLRERLVREHRVVRRLRRELDRDRLHRGAGDQRSDVRHVLGGDDQGAGLDSRRSLPSHMALLLLKTNVLAFISGLGVLGRSSCFGSARSIAARDEQFRPSGLKESLIKSNFGA
jgi:hypothetical protein